MLPLRNDTSCFATPQGLTARVESGFPDVDRAIPRSGYTYNWTGPDGFEADTRNIQFTVPNEPGTYTYYLEVSDDCGQMIFDTASITITGFPFADIEGAVSICTESPEATLDLDFTGDGPWEVTYSIDGVAQPCLLYTSPSPRDATLSRMPSSA